MAAQVPPVARPRRPAGRGARRCRRAALAGMLALTIGPPLTGGAGSVTAQTAPASVVRTAMPDGIATCC